MRHVRRDPPRTFADTILDDVLFHALGRFVANCGHLERTLWVLLARVESRAVEDDADEALALQSLTKPLGALIAEIRVSISKQSDVPRDMLPEIETLLNEISENIVYRNLAIHGAWSLDGDAYRVSYFKKIPGAARDDPASYRAFAAPIAIADVDQASETASIYLTRTLQLANAINKAREV